MSYLKYLLAGVTCISLIITGCTNEKENVQLRTISGNTGSVLIVSTSRQWKGEIGDALRKECQNTVYGMPQPEPAFDLIQTDRSHFEGIFKTFRNVIAIEINKNRIGKKQIEYRKNVFAKGQSVITLKGSSKKEIIELINIHADQITHLIRKKEFNRLTRRFKKHENHKIEKEIHKKLDIDLIIPKEAVIAVCDTQHAWIRIERTKIRGGYKHQISQGILIFKYPYTSKQQFLGKALFKIRDEKLKKIYCGFTKGILYNN